jgi:bifunctional DNA-binding transcriptional regulator/antitoxin component of YhaV-PrlF toxin-antitoxin module
MTVPVLVADTQEQSADRKIIRISRKRQITIPQAYYDRLGFKEDAVCYLDGESIVIKPIERAGREFSEFILSDLIEEGYEGEALLDEFIRRQGRVRPAVRQMIEEAESYASDPDNRTTTEELFEA